MPMPHNDSPLLADLDFLQGLFDAVLTTLTSDDAAAKISAVRQAVQVRRGAGLPACDLHAELAPGETGQAADVVRAFSQQFTNGNLAERVHRLRRRRISLQPGAQPQPGSLLDVVTAAQKRGVPADAVLEAALQVRLQPVFTAHPTEATRCSLLRKEQRMAQVLLAREPSSTASLQDLACAHALTTEMGTAWHTETLTSAPSVADEVEHVTFYLTEVIYDVVPAFYEGMHAALAQCYGDAVAALYAERAQDAGPWVRFGTWVGGDMDGNPNVGPETLKATLHVQQQALLRAYTADLDALSDRLSQSNSRVAVSSAVRSAIEGYQAQACSVLVPARHQDMPYRVLLQHIKARLLSTDQASQAPGAPRPYPHKDAFFADLKLIATSLDGHSGQIGGSHAVRRVMRRVATFGLHLAALDVRQDSLVHRQAAAALLGDKDLETGDRAGRVECYAQALAQATSCAPPWDAATLAARAQDSEPLRRMLAVFEAMVAAQERYGPECIGLYIISMAQDVDDVFAVLLLAHAAKLTREDQPGRRYVPLQVAPLFETVPDLQASGAVFEALCSHPIWQEHLAAHKQVQAIMLGYSDSNKESGFVASRAALRRAEVALVEVAQRNSITLRLFHGRGGTLGRGGSKPREAILASADPASHLRITEQGEIIHAKYGHPELTLRTLELMGGALLQRQISPPEPAVPAQYDAALTLCADASRDAYRQLVVHTPGFFDYFSLATPIDVITRLRIGSRPPSRRAAKGLGDLRAIPWVFAWMQNRQMLPSWYGLGEGLEACAAALGQEVLQDMYRHWPFFTHLIDDAAVGLAKSDMDIGGRYAALAGASHAHIWDTIRASFANTVVHVLKVTGAASLLDKEPVLARGIKRRNFDIDPISVMQLEALGTWRAQDRQDPQQLQLLMLTVKGIAKGLQNTA